MDTASSPSEAWSDTELERLCRVLLTEIASYESGRSEHQDNVDTIILLCRDALHLFQNEQRLRLYERTPVFVKLREKYPVGAEVSIKMWHTSSWVKATVTEHKRGGGIVVTGTSGLEKNHKELVIDPALIRPRSKRTRKAT